MKLIPAIDIMDGDCVQLIGGDPRTKKLYGNPVEIALEFKNLGVEILHIVDLDATLNMGNNLETVLKICRIVKLPVHFGGGIRDPDRARFLLKVGIDRIILGTMAVKDYSVELENIKKLTDEFGPDRLIIAIDSKEGNIVVKGWQEKTNLKATEFVKDFSGLVWGFLYTDVDREGKMKGINIERTKEVIESTELPVIASGGISSNSDIEKLEEIGAWGVVLGKALYEGRISLKEMLTRNNI